MKRETAYGIDWLNAIQLVTNQALMEGGVQ
jgi:hypothetical protein